MPIYEFYCSACNTIYKFFSRTVNTEKVPHCPECENVRLERRVSTFAAISGKKGDDAGDEELPPIDESKMEQAMALLSREADKIDEDDPRQAANLMRKLSEATGLKLGPGMEEALSRMEKGEDPEKIEEEMGDLLEEEDPFILPNQAKSAAPQKKPRVSEKIYDL